MEYGKFKEFMESAEVVADYLKTCNCERFITPVFYDEFSQKIKQLRENSDEIMNTHRDLKIGIIGQVKAGKSSFINALVFNGQDVLPKAATPMTAALTRISYSANQEAKIVFYSQKDWEVIENNSKHFDSQLEKLISEEISNQKAQSSFITKAVNKIKEEAQIISDMIHQDTQDQNDNAETQLSEQEIEALKSEISPLLQACKELTEMAGSDPEILKKLGTEETVSVADLSADIKEYVGAKGKYTPIVKHMELTINNDFLKGFQIIDTPGLGDPIASRGEKTKEFLMACDIVVLISPTSQFLKREDIQLIINTLPDKEINRAVLIGSQFDNVLLDNPGRGRQPLIKVLRDTRKKLNDSALRALSDARNSEKGIVHSRVLEYLEKEVAEQINADKSLYYVASLIHNAAIHMECGEELNEEETHALNCLKRRFDGFEESPEFLRELGGIDRLNEKVFSKIRTEKDDVIADRQAEFTHNQANILLSRLNDIQIESENTMQILKNEDADSLKARMEASKRALAAMRREIKKTFDEYADRTKRYLVHLAHSIKIRADDYTDINVSEEYKDTHRTEKTGFIFKDIHHWTEREYFKVANVVDVTHNLHQYIHDIEHLLAEEIEKAVEIDSLRNRIKRIVLKAFEQAVENYNENDIIGPVEAVIRHLTIPEFNVVDSEIYERKIISEFPDAQVKGEDIAKLKLHQSVVLEEISSDICQILEKKANDITKSFEEQAIYFVDDVKNQIEAKIKLIMDGIQNIDNRLNEFDEFLAKIAGFKQEFRQFLN